MKRLATRVYERPYVVIFAAAAAMSAHGLYTAAVELGHIPPLLAWSYVLIVDLLAVSAYRTWRKATEAGKRHWAGGVAFAATAGTVAMNVIAGHPELAASWAGPAIAGFPPVAALLATALRMAEERLRPVTADTADTPADMEIVRPVSAVAIGDRAPVTLPDSRTWPVSADITLDNEADTAPVTDREVAAIVAGHVAGGGHASDPELTAAVATQLAVSDRTARRRLAPFRAVEA
jgi:hypothetical protein